MRRVLPLVDRALLERHPLTVLGSWLDQARLDVDPASPGVELVGWVPSVRPYLERPDLRRPPLAGAGVKGKVIQSMMACTPVVTTPIGAEGLDLVQGETRSSGRTPPTWRRASPACSPTIPCGSAWPARAPTTSMRATAPPCWARASSRSSTP